MLDKIDDMIRQCDKYSHVEKYRFAKVFLLDMKQMYVYGDETFCNKVNSLIKLFVNDNPNAEAFFQLANFPTCKIRNAMICFCIDNPDYVHDENLSLGKKK